MTELTIVLGAVGVIAAGVWTIGVQGRESSRQHALTTDIATVVRNMRAYYSGQAGVTGTFAALTAQLTGLSTPIIPADMLRTGGGCAVAAPGQCADTPWGFLDAATAANGSFGLCAWDPSAGGAKTGACAAAGTTTQFFSVELQAMPLGSCMQAVQVNSSFAAPPGLFDVAINGKSIVASGVSGFPILPSTAQANCAGDDTIDFVFRLTTPQS